MIICPFCNAEFDRGEFAGHIQEECEEIHALAEFRGAGTYWYDLIASPYDNTCTLYHIQWTFDPNNNEDVCNVEPITELKALHLLLDRHTVLIGEANRLKTTIHDLEARIKYEGEIK